MIAIQKNFRIIIESDSQPVVNSNHDEICAHKDIINLVENIRIMCLIDMAHKGGGVELCD